MIDSPHLAAMPGRKATAPPPLGSFAIGAIALIGVLLLASSWLAFPYLLEGRMLLNDVGWEVKDQKRFRMKAVTQTLLRFADDAGEAEIDVLYATPKYFEATDHANRVEEFRPDRYLVFLVNEATHTMPLPQTPITASLLVNGVEHRPSDIEAPSNPEHHRLSIVRFARFGEDGRPIVPEEAGEIRLVVSNDWTGSGPVSRSVSWPVPIDYPEALDDGGIWSPILVLALSSGLLSSVLTPCLLQLVVIYLVTLTGLSADQLAQGQKVPKVAVRRVMLIALSFVAGFVVLYTAAGAAIGYAGSSLQMLSSQWSRPISIGSGFLIIALGLWMGIKARAPLVCNIPMARSIRSLDSKGFFGSALIAFGFSIGCMTCFSGAIIATLLIYVGALGSASIGALVLFLFSVGVAIPFLLAAFFLSRMTPLLGRLQAYSPQIGLVSMLVVIAFGIVLVTDNFHTVSDLIYPYLGLS